MLFDRDWIELVEHNGVAKAQGMEWFLHKKMSRWNGWAGYTLSWAQRKFENLNNEHRYYSTYDRRHDLEVFVNYQVNERCELSDSWQYQTGHRFAIPIAETYHYTYYTEKNNYILPAFHRLNELFGKLGNKFLL